MKRLVLIAAVLVAACKDDVPQHTYALCIHTPAAPFVAGNCPALPSYRQGQDASVIIESENLVGAPRTADLTIVNSPSGWNVTLGGATIAVPGQQTMTFSVPSNTAPGSYPIRIQASVGGREVEIVIWNVNITALV